MKEIFENLYENVSEACFEDIVSMVEELILERNKENKKKKNEWEKDSATDLKIKRTLDPETTRQLELNDPGSTERMKEGTKKNLLGVSDVKVFRDENKKGVSEACFEDIVSMVEEHISEDIVSRSKGNFETAKAKDDKLKERINKVLRAKKENGTLDDSTRDKAWGIAYTGKTARKLRKAMSLAQKAEELPKSNNYLSGDNGYQNLTKNEKGKIKHENRYEEHEKPALGDPED